MRPFRTILIAAAWFPTLVALAFIWIYARQQYPYPLRLIASLLSSSPADSGDIRYITRFDRERDFEIWKREGATLSQAGEWGRIELRKGKQFSGIRLADYVSGPARIKDWSAYRWLKWDMLSPRGAQKPFRLILKDDSNRRVDRAFHLSEGTVSSAAIDLSELPPWLDLTRMAELHFFIDRPENNIVIDMRNIRLERGGGTPGEILGKPFVVFEGIDIPDRARLGNTIVISASLSLTQPQTIPYSVFIHLFHERDSEVNVPAHRAGYLHIEKRPFVPVPEWRVGAPMEVGPFYIHLPKFNPLGRYMVRLGLFNERAPGRGPRGVRYEGAFDYNGSYPKCRYTNPGIRDFIVGSIVIEEH